MATSGCGQLGAAMAWHFEGTGLDITMGTTRSGTVQVNANGIQLCRPSAGDMRVIKLVDAIAGLFTIDSSAAAPIDYDGAGFGLKEFYEQEPDQSAAMIVYYATDSGMPAAVGASIIVPSAHMTSVLEMAKTLIGRPDLRYVTTIDFFGLSVEDAHADIPTYSQFTASRLYERRAYFSRGATFNVMAKKQHP
jgi:hypothetical protein